MTPAAIRPGDVVVLAVGLAIIGILFQDVYSNDSVHAVQVMQPDHSMENFPAWQARTVRVSGPLGETVLEIRDGKVRVIASPCSQKLCIRAGWLEHAGEAAACVPNRVSVALLGDDPRFDAMNF